MTLNLPDPRDTPFERWCAELALQDASVPLPVPVVEWRRWADFVAQYSVLAAFNVPNPHGFADWRAWATRVKELAS